VMVEMAQPIYCGLSHPLQKEDEEAIRMVNIWEKIKGLQKLFATRYRVLRQKKVYECLLALPLLYLAALSSLNQGLVIEAAVRNE